MTLTVYTLGLGIGLTVATVNGIRNRKNLSNLNNEVVSHFMTTILYSVTSSLGVVLGLCSIYYGLTGSYLFGFSAEFAKIPLVIGSFMMLLASAVTMLDQFKKRV